MAGKSHIKFTYQQYDYSFLQPKESLWESFTSSYLPTVRQVYAHTIANDLVEVTPMDAPVGQLFYFEPTTTTSVEGNGDITATVYEPTTDTDYRDIIRGWEITLTPPPAKYFGKTAADFMVANREAKKKQKSAEHFRRLNLIRKINRIRYGKKV